MSIPQNPFIHIPIPIRPTPERTQNPKRKRSETQCRELVKKVFTHYEKETQQQQFSPPPPVFQVSPYSQPLYTPLPSSGVYSMTYPPSAFQMPLYPQSLQTPSLENNLFLNSFGAPSSLHPSMTPAPGSYSTKTLFGESRLILSREVQLMKANINQHSTIRNTLLKTKKLKFFYQTSLKKNIDQGLVFFKNSTIFSLYKTRICKNIYNYTIAPGETFIRVFHAVSLDEGIRVLSLLTASNGQKRMWASLDIDDELSAQIFQRCGFTCLVRYFVSKTKLKQIEANLYQRPAQMQDRF